MTGPDSEVGCTADCPFCGFPMEAYQAFPQASEGWVIGGDHDDTCPLHGFLGERECYATRDVANAAWNARVVESLAHRQHEAQAAALVEALERADEWLTLAWVQLPLTTRRNLQSAYDAAKHQRDAALAAYEGAAK